MNALQQYDVGLLALISKAKITAILFGNKSAIKLSEEAAMLASSGWEFSAIEACVEAVGQCVSVFDELYTSVVKEARKVEDGLLKEINSLVK